MHAVITTMEDFYRNRFLEFAHNRMRLRHLLKEADFLNGELIVKVSDKVYRVPSSQDSTRRYEVIADKGLCSCRIGSNGAFCKHQCGVAGYIGENLHK